MANFRFWSNFAKFRPISDFGLILPSLGQFQNWLYLGRPKYTLEIKPKMATFLKLDHSHDFDAIGYIK